MRAILFLVSMLLAVPAFSVTMRAGDATGEAVLLYDKECTNQKILAFVRQFAPSYDGSFQSGTYVSPKGAESPLCWTVLPTMDVGLIHEDGDIGRLPIGAFTPLVESKSN